MPGQQATATARQDVVDGQFSSTGTHTAVLAGVAISAIEIEARKCDILIADTRVSGQHDHFQRSQAKRRGPNRMFFGEVAGTGDIVPGLEVVGLVGFGVDDGGDIASDQADGDSGRERMDGGPATIQNQCWSLEQ